jgi:hypothetical protein
VKCGSASDSRERRRRRRRQRQQQEEEEEERRRDETKGTRDPTDFVTKSGHEKKAEQTPFLLPTWDKTHAQNTAPNWGPQFNPESDIDIDYRLQGFFFFSISFSILFIYRNFGELGKKITFFLAKIISSHQPLGQNKKWILINGLVIFIDGFLGIKKL